MKAGDASVQEKGHERSHQATSRAVGAGYLTCLGGADGGVARATHPQQWRADPIRACRDEKTECRGEE